MIGTKMRNADARNTSTGIISGIWKENVAKW